jgi:hypothetical protein
MGKRFAIVIGVAAGGVMALGTQTAAAPVPEDFDDLRDVETRVEVTRVVQKAAGDYRVKGRVHSRAELCEKNRKVHLQKANDHGGLDWDYIDGTTRRGKFSIRVPQSEKGNTFRVFAGDERPNYSARIEQGLEPRDLECQSDKSRRFRARPSS